MGGRGVIADRVLRVAHGGGIPECEVTAVATGGGREAAVLDGHVGDEVGQIPSCARRRAQQVGTTDGVDDVDRGQDGAAMGGEKFGG